MILTYGLTSMLTFDGNSSLKISSGLAEISSGSLKISSGLAEISSGLGKFVGVHTPPYLKLC